MGIPWNRLEWVGMVGKLIVESGEWVRFVLFEKGLESTETAPTTSLTRLDWA
jgi:hypothetical protein